MMGVVAMGVETHALVKNEFKNELMEVVLLNCVQKKMEN
jgi:hypothetical protein